MRCRAAMFTRCSVADSAENPTKGSHGQVQPIGSLRTVPPAAHWRLLMSRRLLSASLIAFFATTTTLAVGGCTFGGRPGREAARGGAGPGRDAARRAATTANHHKRARAAEADRAPKRRPA